MMGSLVFFIITNIAKNCVGECGGIDCHIHLYNINQDNCQAARLLIYMCMYVVIWMGGKGAIDNRFSFF